MTMMERRRAMMGAKAEANGLENKPLKSLSNGSYEIIDNTLYLNPTINTFNFAWGTLKKPLQLSAGDVLTISFLLLECNAFYSNCAVNSHYPGQQYGVLQKGVNFVNNQASVSFTMRSGDSPIERVGIAPSKATLTQNKKIKISVAVNGAKLF